MTPIRATVTQVSPLRVRVDGAATDSPALYASGVLVVGTRVHVAEVAGSGLLVLGGGADTGWRLVGPTQPTTFQNGWTNYVVSPDTARAAFRRTADGLVVLRGYIASGTVGQVAFTLPVGYRPAAQLIFTVDSMANPSRVDVLASGAVTVVSGSNVGLSVDNVRFFAEQ